MARLPIMILVTLQVIGGLPAEAMPREQKPVPNTLQRRVQRFTETWLLAGDMRKAIAYVSQEAVHSPCLIDEVRKRSQGESQESVQGFLREYLAERREEILANNSTASASKVLSLAAFIEPLPIANRDIGGRLLPTTGESTLLKPGKKTIQSLACDEKEAAWLVRLSKKGPIAGQAFRAKGAPEGKIAPIVLFWRKEKAGWKVLAVGTISQ